MSKKLEQVLEYLISNQQDKAKELLHQVFIEKARKIHEELISQDDLDEMEHMGGDEGDDLENDLKSHDSHLKELNDEIDAEETMSEEADDDLDADLDMGDDDMGDDMDDMGDDDTMDMDDMGDDMGDDDMGDDMGSEEGETSSVEDSIGDLEDALAALKAEFEKLEGGDDSDDMDDMDDMGDMEADDMEADDMDDMEADDMEADDDTADAEDDEEKMDESWLEEDFDDLAEAIELERVSVTMGGEVGSGKGQGAPADKSRSPLPTSQTSRMGAKPVSVDSKHHSGYNKETAPSSKDMGLANRRKKADAGMSKVSKEGNSSAAINKTASEFGADTVGKNSILSKSPRK